MEPLDATITSASYMLMMQGTTLPFFLPSFFPSFLPSFYPSASYVLMMQGTTLSFFIPSFFPSFLLSFFLSFLPSTGTTTVKEGMEGRNGRKEGNYRALYTHTQTHDIYMCNYIAIHLSIYPPIYL
jgi:hypothetical protein